nr:hypothetical protein DBT45_10455 [Aerococcus tenax]
MNEKHSGIEAVIEEMKALYRPSLEKVGTVDGEPVHVFVRPGGMVSESAEKYLSEFRANPRRRKGQSTHVTLDSLIAFTNRFKDEGSVLFANGSRTSPQLLTVFDYNEALEGLEDKSQAAPRRSTPFLFPTNGPHGSPRTARR